MNSGWKKHTGDPYPWAKLHSISNARVRGATRELCASTSSFALLIHGALC